MEITGISKSIDVERLTSERSTLLGIGTRQYVKVVFYVDLNQNRRKVKVKGVYVDVINIYGLVSFADLCVLTGSTWKMILTEKFLWEEAVFI